MKELLRRYLLQWWPVIAATGVLGMVTVLMVEDEPIIRNLVGEELTYAGFDVVVVGNADEAVAVLEASNDIRLVFTDIDMPGSMDGLKLASAVRDRWPPIHIIITSGKKRPLEMPSEAIFVPKPYLSNVVVDAMKTFEIMRCCAPRE